MVFSEQCISVYYPVKDGYEKLVKVLQDNFVVLPNTTDMFESDIRIGEPLK